MDARNPQILIDSSGRQLVLAEEVGRGGEGIVLGVRNQPDVVAKVYHQTPLPAKRVAKLQTLTTRYSESLASTSAWPSSVLYSPDTGQPCGIMMPRVSDSRQLHELYGTVTRRRYFPDARWHHLVLAARNVAAAFVALHSHGVVIGDVNQGNLLVDSRMCVRFIDCDSFQIANGESVFHCLVATPHFTPPELQSANLQQIQRTANHDAFGLAVLIFHLLFVGRHPFAGRYHGSGDLSIEEAIAQQRFAFSRDRTHTMMEPPPASLMMDDIPVNLAAMFESAFRGGVAGTQSRPSPEQWVEHLESLIRQRTTCGFDKSHVHFRELPKCPWCRIEVLGGPQFFLAFDWSSTPTDEDLCEIEELVHQAKETAFPDFTIRELRIPESMYQSQEFTWRGFSAAHGAAGLWLVGCALCVVGLASLPFLLAGTLATLASGTFLIASKECRNRRQRFAELTPKIRKLRNEINGVIRRSGPSYEKREKEFEQIAATVRKGTADYHSKGEPLLNAVRKIAHAGRSAQKRNFLQQILIRENYQSIRGVTENTVTMLESYGVESALEVEQRLLSGIPSVSTSVTMELIHWRSEIEKQFAYQSEVPPELKDLDGGHPETMRRLQFLLARKLLADAKRLKTVVQATEEEVESARAKFYALAAQNERLEEEARHIQSAGYGLGHIVVRSPMIVAWLTIGIPLACFLCYFLLR